jgi:hypothetical protein
MSELARRLDIAPFEGETWEDHVSQALTLKEEMQRNFWGLAQVCASVERNYGDSAISKFGSEIGYSAASIYKFIKTWQVFSNSQNEIVEDLTFTHHAIAARAPDPAEAIDQAAQLELSTRQLEKFVEDVLKKQGQQNGHQGEHTHDTIACPRCQGKGEIQKPT